MIVDVIVSNGERKLEPSDLQSSSFEVHAIAKALARNRHFGGSFRSREVDPHSTITTDTSPLTSSTLQHHETVIIATFHESTDA